jgi:hypothetical protein
MVLFHQFYSRRQRGREGAQGEQDSRDVGLVEQTQAFVAREGFAGE